jgi:hypothetical protein
MIPILALSFVESKPILIRKNNKNTVVNIKDVRDQSEKNVSFEIIGNITLSKTKIVDMVKDLDDDDEIRNTLKNSGMFKNVVVKRLNNQIIINLTEEPAIANVELKVHGLFLPDKKQIIEHMKLAKGDILTSQKIAYAQQVLQSTFTTNTNLKDIAIKIKQLKKPNNTVDLRFEVKLIYPKRLTKVNFTGNKQISSRQLYRNMHWASMPSHPIPFLTFQSLVQSDYTLHKKSLERYAASIGFLDFQVNSIYTENGYFDIDVTEGERYRISEIKIDNQCKYIQELKLTSFIKTLKINDYYNKNLVDSAKLKMKNYLFGAGLYSYIVSTSEEKEEGTNRVRLVFTVAYDPKSVKIGKIIVKNNKKISDQIVKELLTIRPGDYVGSDALKLATTQAKIPQVMNMTDFKVVDSDINGCSDIEYILEEQSGNLLLQLMWTNATEGLTADLNTPNLLGNGIGAVIKVDSESVTAALQIPDFRYGLKYLFRFSFGLDGLQSEYFHPKSLIDFLNNAMCTYRYKNVREAVDATRKDMTENASLERSPNIGIWSNWDESTYRYKNVREAVDATDMTENASLERSPNIGMSPNWDESKDSIWKEGNNDKISDWKEGENKNPGISGRYFSAAAMISIPVFNKYNIATLGLNFKNRVFSYLNEEPITRLYAIYNEKYLKSLDRKKIPYFKQPNGSILNLNNHTVYLKENQFSDADKAELKEKGVIRRVSEGCGLGRVIKSQKITEKIEFGPSVQYTHILNLESLNFSKVIFNVKADLILGTTKALKLLFSLNSIFNLTDSLYLDTNFIFGSSINNHFLDNFKSSELGMCVAMGPVDTYSFIPLGGSLMFKFNPKLVYKFDVTPLLTLYPSIGFSVGSLWRSGCKAMRMSSDLINKRNLPQNSIDIAQDGFNPLGLLSPGLKMQIGPVILEFTGNIPLFNNTGFTMFRPIEINFGLKMG